MSAPMHTLVPHRLFWARRGRFTRPGLYLWTGTDHVRLLATGRCKHATIRCVHGDEIHARRGRRRVCVDCRRSLKGALPARCWYSGRLHTSETTT